MKSSFTTAVSDNGVGSTHECHSCKDSLKEIQSPKLNNSGAGISPLQSKLMLPISKRRASKLDKYSIQQRIENEKKKENNIETSIFQSSNNSDSSSIRLENKNPLNSKGNGHFYDCDNVDNHPWYIISPK